MRYGVFFKLKPDAEEGYAKAHAEIWPEMTQVLNQAGYKNYSIWRHGAHLFAYYELLDEAYARQVLRSSEVYGRWRSYMEEFVYQEPETGQKEWPMELVFLHPGLPEQK